MLKPLKAFMGLTRQDRTLVLRAATTLVVSWVRLRVQGIEETSGLGCPTRERDGRSEATGLGR